MFIITGGAGFIGSNIAHDLLKSSKEIIIFDKVDHKEKKKNLEWLEIKRLYNPFNIFKFIKENSHKIDAIIHMGAISSTAETNIKLLNKYNLDYSSRLFDHCNKYSIKLIYASSAATYGNGSNGFNDDNSLMNFIKLSPINLYGLSKHLFDLKVLEQLTLNKDTPSRPIGLKFFNVYGPREFHKEFMMSPIPKFYQEIMLKKQIKLFKSHLKIIKNGHQSRDFVYIKDCVRVVNWMIKNENKKGIFNIGSGRSESFLKLSNIIFDKLKVKPNIKYIDTPKKILKGYQYMTKADLKNLRKIGYKDKFSAIEDGVCEYIDFLLN